MIDAAGKGQLGFRPLYADRERFVLAKPNAKLGLIFLDVKRAAQNVGKVV